MNTKESHKLRSIKWWIKLYTIDKMMKSKQFKGVETIFDCEYFK